MARNTKKNDSSTTAAQKKTPKKAQPEYIDKLLEAESVKRFQLKHEIGKRAGKRLSGLLCKTHVIAEQLNRVGVGGTITMAQLKLNCGAFSTAAQNHIERWIEQQTGGNGIGGIKIQNPKYSLAKNGVITVNKLFKPRSAKRGHIIGIEK